MSWERTVCLECKFEELGFCHLRERSKQIWVKQRACDQFVPKEGNVSDVPKINFSSKRLMEGVQEYNEGELVYLTQEGSRFVVLAYNEGGNNSTKVDLLQLVWWLQQHCPDILAEAKHV